MPRLVIEPGGPPAVVAGPFDPDVRVRRYVIVMAIAFSTLSMLACTQPPAPTVTAPDRLDRIEGRVMEVVDSPPYAYLRLKTATGPVWTAVPIGHAGLGTDVVVTGGVAVRNHVTGRDPTY